MPTTQLTEGVQMGEKEALEEFWEGLALLRAGNAPDALPHLRRSVELDAHNAFYISYLGLATGLAENNWNRAEDLCYKALREERQQPKLYLNLAEVYCHTGRKEDAVWILKAGLELTKQDRSIREALSQLGIRQPRVFAFLDRKHILNRNLGKLRHNLALVRKQIP